jgi:hypothetical protein
MSRFRRRIRCNISHKCLGIWLPILACCASTQCALALSMGGGLLNDPTRWNNSLSVTFPISCCTTPPNVADGLPTSTSPGRMSYSSSTVTPPPTPTSKPTSCVGSSLCLNYTKLVRQGLIPLFRKCWRSMLLMFGKHEPCGMMAAKKLKSRCFFDSAQNPLIF